MQPYLAQSTNSIHSQRVIYVHSQRVIYVHSQRVIYVHSQRVMSGQLWLSEPIPNDDITVTGLELTTL